MRCAFEDLRGGRPTKTSAEGDRRRDFHEFTDVYRPGPPAGARLGCLAAAPGTRVDRALADRPPHTKKNSDEYRVL